MQAGESKHHRLHLKIFGESQLLCDALSGALISDCTVSVHQKTSTLLPSDANEESVILIEIDSFDISEACKQLARSLPAVAIVRSPTQDLLSGLLKLGFAGILTLKASLDDLRRSLEHVRKGGTYLDAQVQQCLSEALVAPKREQLTSRERQVAILVAEGLTSRAIAKELSLSTKTVNNHRRNIFRKLGLHDAISLTRHVVRSGWVPNHPTNTIQPADAAAALKARTSPVSRSRSVRPKVRYLHSDRSG